MNEEKVPFAPVAERRSTGGVVVVSGPAECHARVGKKEGEEEEEVC